jgi:hypothetical protein
MRSDPILEMSKVLMTFLDWRPKPTINEVIVAQIQSIGQDPCQE